MTTIRTMPTEKLLTMLPVATAELQVKIQAVLQGRNLGAPIQPMRCITVK